jgi:DNA invertase Pin-like site-specific DNA recombinase
MVRVLLYARCSTDRGEQDPNNQLYFLRDYCAQRGWEIIEEYVDLASAGDHRRRVAWRDLLAYVYRGGADVVVVTKLDRSFRSAKDTYDNLAYLDNYKVGFVAATQPIDTTTSTGKLLLGVLAAVAEFELSLIRERTMEGLERARKQGKKLGWPPGAKDAKPKSKRGYLLRYSK